MLKIGILGIIGIGTMGKIRAQAIEASKQGQVVAVYDPGVNDCPYFG